MIVGLPASARATSEEDRIARLEARIADLENRLLRAETKAPPKERASKRNSRQSAAPANASAAPPSGTPGDLPQPQEVKRDVTPSEFNVFRDNAATLGRQKLEASIGVNYQKRSSLLQGDRAAQTTANIRYGLFDGVEIALNVPYYLSFRDTQIAPTQTLSNKLQGIGDISLQVSAILFKETLDWPGIVGTAGLTFPTGRSPAVFGANYFAGANPINPFFGYLTRGDYSGAAGLQIYKTLDPIIVFAGGGVEYALTQRISGYKIGYQPRFNYNMGFAFAVNEKTTVGFQVSGSTEGNFRVNGQAIKLTSQEPIVARLVVVQRIAADTYLEPSVTFGLSQSAPDLALGMTLRRRF